MFFKSIAQVEKTENGKGGFSVCENIHTVQS